ncbi:MAG: DUF4105 domain-containing protein [Pseudomonadota bacterium]
MKLLPSITAVMLFLASVSVDADERIETVANEPVWHGLVHYEKKGSGFKSAIHATSFFLATNGQTDPLAELQATLDAFRKAEVGAPTTDDPRCRFPARHLWLSQQNLIDSPMPTCRDFDNWVHGANTQSISIVFATGYLGNPASFYGHTLLKFNADEAFDRSDLLDVTVNYGAVIPPNTGMVEYIVRGALGGFDAGFSHIQYYYHDHAYGDLELRDLWEYELNLTEEEVRFLMSHAWEVLGKEYTYYFFRKNCAFRMAELLELLPDIEIIPPRRGWTIPQSIVRRASALSRGDAPLVKTVRYHPSRQSLFNQRYRQLNRNQRSAVSKFVTRRGDEALAAISELPEGEQPAVIDTLIDYLQFRLPKDAPKDAPEAVAYRQLIVYRFGLPPAPAATLTSSPKDPGKDRKPGYFSVGAQQHSDDGFAGELRWRAAYYDTLDTAASHSPNSELTMGDLIIGIRDGDVELRRAQLFRVEAVNSGRSGLPGDSGRSWRLALGMERQDLACSRCAVARFEGDIGLSRWLGDQVIAGAYIGGALQDNRNDNGNLWLRARAYANWHGPRGLRMRFSYEYREHLDGALGSQDVYELVGRYPLGNNVDLRFSHTRNIADESMLSVGYYW